MLALAALPLLVALARALLSKGACCPRAAARLSELLHEG